MNKVELMGRLVKKPETRYTSGDNAMAISRFSIAVDRKKKDETDFISIVAFGKQGEFCEKYLDKGTKVVLVGRIQTGSYTNKDGVKVYTTEVVAEEIEFAESKKNSSENTEKADEGDEYGFVSIPEGEDEELPFGNPR